MSISTQGLQELSQGLLDNKWIYHSQSSFGICDKYNGLTRMFMRSVKDYMPFYFSTDPRHVLNKLKKVSWEVIPFSNVDNFFRAFNTRTNSKYDEEINSYLREKGPAIKLYHYKLDLVTWHGSLTRKFRAEVYKGFDDKRRTLVQARIGYLDKTYEISFYLSKIIIVDTTCSLMSQNQVRIDLSDKYRKIQGVVLRGKDESRIPVETVKKLILEACNILKHPTHSG